MDLLKPIWPFAMLLLALVGAPGPAPAAPVVQPVSKPIITVGERRFRDLDADGRLTSCEDWQLPVAMRVDDGHRAAGASSASGDGPEGHRINPATGKGFMVADRAATAVKVGTDVLSECRRAAAISDLVAARVLDVLDEASGVRSARAPGDDLRGQRRCRT